MSHLSAHALLPLPSGWEARIDPKGRLYYVNHQLKTTSWTHPLADPNNGKVKGVITYSPLYPQSFLTKLTNFRKFCQNIQGSLIIPIRRNNIFEDSFRELSPSNIPAHHFHKKLRVQFIGEEGLDYGGLTREWFYALSHEMFQPNYALFKYSSNSYSYIINPNSQINPEHLTYFKFVGRIFGLALFNAKQLDAWFPLPFYKLLVDQELVPEDMKYLDPSYWKNLKWMTENPIDGVLEQTFAVDVEVFGDIKTIDLIPNGSNILVTDATINDFIEKVCLYKLRDSIAPQMDALLQGIHDVIPKHILQIFSPLELELLVSGLSTININDWKEHAQYRNMKSNDPIVSLFWDIIERIMSEEDRSSVLQFVCGTSRVPLDGFGGLLGSTGRLTPFTLEKGIQKPFFVAHTCFNRLTIPADLFTPGDIVTPFPLKPPFRSKKQQEFHRRLMLSINESTGFGIQ